VHNLLAKPQPSHIEFVILFFFVMGTTIFFGYFDYSIFDDYIKPFYQDPNFEPTTYREVFGNMVLFIAIGFGIFRILMAKLAGAKITVMLLLIGLLWAVSIWIFVATGWIDFYYYELRVIQGMEEFQIPDQLEWLDTVGIFQYTKQFGDTQSVDRSDLYLTMAIGMGIFLALWFSFEHHYKKGTLKNLGLV